MVHDDTLDPDVNEPDMDGSYLTITGQLTVPGDSTDTWDNVIAAPDFRLQETELPPGWALQSISCTYQDIFQEGKPWVTADVYSNGAYNENFELPSGTLADPTACTIVNETSTLRVAKASLGDGTADFTFPVPGHPDQVLSLGEISGYLQFTPGTAVSLTETLPTGGLPWEQLGVQCVRDDTGAVVAAGSAGAVDVTTIGGTNVTCTFTNQQMAQVQIAKVADGATTDFTFTWSGVDGATTDLLGNGDTSAYHVVRPNTGTLPGYTPAGAYQVTEQQMPGYQLGAITCTDTDSGAVVGNPYTADFKAAPGESITCTYINVPTGSLTIVKNAVPNHAQDFTFTTTGGSTLPPTFQLDDDTDGTLPASQTFPNLVNGTYTITEADIPAGWSLTDLTCVADGTGTTFDYTEDTVSVGLVGETVTCTFTNTLAMSTLTLTKAWVNDVAGDEVGLSAVGTVNTTTATGSSTAGGAGADTTVPATRDIYAGETVSLTEAFVHGGDRYNTTLTCYTADEYGRPTGDPLHTATGLTDQYTVPDVPVPVVCVFENTAKTATLTLAKDWMGSPIDPDNLDTADLTASGVLGTGTAANTNDGVDTDIATLQVVLGEDVRLSEVITTAGADGMTDARFLTNLVCEVDGTAIPVNYNVGGTTGTVLVGMDTEGTTIECTFQNERRSAHVTFVKRWGNGAPGDQAVLEFEGLYTTVEGNLGTRTSTVPEVGGTPAWMSTYTDWPNALTVDVYGGEYIDFREVLPDTNTGTYISQIRCMNEAGVQILAFPIGLTELTDYQVPDRLFTNAVDLDDDGEVNVTCMVENIRRTVTLDLAKTWENAVAGDTALLEAEDSLVGDLTVPSPDDPAVLLTPYADSATSTATGAVGTEADTTNVATIQALTGGTVLIRETLTSDTTYTTATPVCTYSAADGTTVTLDVQPTDTALEYSVTMPPAPNAHVSCTFVNEAPRGTIVIVKNVEGADGTFEFTKDWTGMLGDVADSATGFELTTVDGTSSTTWTNVLAGSYTVAEVDDSAEFDFTGLTCVDPDGGTVTAGLTGTIDLDADETVTCTYTNTEKATLVVIKNAVPNDDQTFSFTTTGPAGSEIGGTLAAFDLTDDGVTEVANTNTGLVSGNDEYQVTETPVAGWTLSEASVCATLDAAGQPVEIPIDPATGTVAVTPLPGSTVTCTFVNEAAASTLLLRKDVADTTPADLPWSFSFSLTPHDPATLLVSGMGPVDEDGEGTVQITDLVLNQQYTLAELPTEGWEMGTLTCSINGTAYADQDPAAAGYQFTITQPDSSMECTLTNTPILPQLTLLKTVDLAGTASPAVDTDWTLTATGPTPGVTGVEGDAAITKADVAPGTYALSETGSSDYDAYMTAGAWQCWTLDEAGARGDAFGMVGSEITLALADRVECEIVNTAQPGAYTISKGVETDGDGDYADSGHTVMPGDVLTYQLSVTHTGGAPIAGIVLTDDLSAVLANATLVEPLGAGLTLDGTTLTWTVPTLEPEVTLTATYQVTVDAGAWGMTLANVVNECPEGECTTDNPIPSYEITKTSDPVDGSTVKPGETVEYTLSVTNTSDAVLEGFTATDDLSDVLTNATLVQTVEDLAVKGLTLDGTTLTWTVPTLQPAESATVTYAVVVDDGAWGVTLANAVTPTEGGECPPDECTTENPTPAYELTKFSDPASGSTVEPGETITYYLRAENTSAAVVEGFTATDDLTDVLLHATLGTLNSALTLDGTTLTWAIPTLQPGQAVTVSFTASVNAGEWGVEILNVATPSEGGECPPDECTTEHPTQSYELAKSSDPASGSTVKAGDTVAYTLTATNTSEGVVEGAVATDDLADVLDNATLGTLAAGLTLDGTTLSWAIPTLQPGQAATVTYTVTVKTVQVAQSLRNVVTPDGGGECPPDECTTEHPIPSYTLTKTSDPTDGSTVQPGATVTYTLTVTNTGEVGLTGALVTDDLSKVLDDATLTEPLAAGLTRSGTTLTWAVPDVAVGATVTVSYTVTIGTDQWSQHLLNVATPDKDGQCAVDCSTEHTTPSAPVPPPPPPPPPPLPPTGADSLPLAGMSLGLLLLGAGAYATSRKVRRS